MCSVRQLRWDRDTGVCDTKCHTQEVHVSMRTLPDKVDVFARRLDAARRPGTASHQSIFFRGEHSLRMERFAIKIGVDRPTNPANAYFAILAFIQDRMPSLYADAQEGRIVPPVLTALHDAITMYAIDRALRRASTVDETAFAHAVAWAMYAPEPWRKRVEQATRLLNLDAFESK